MHRRRSIRWLIVLAVLVLTFLVADLFVPILSFEFVDFDVNTSVVDNPHIRGLTRENLAHILTSRCIASYYPVRTLTYAIDFSIWGLNPFGFKLTNCLIHWINVVLVFWLLLRIPSEFGDGGGSRPREGLEVGAAAFSAAVFAIHPVVVEPVAWIAGREELLMTLGALACFHFHLSALRLRRQGAARWRSLACHAAAAVSCALACLSNAVAAVIPALIVTWDVLSLRGPKWKRIVFGSAALWAIAALTIALKGPGSDAALVGDIGVLSGQRVVLVLNVCWRNLAALACPVALAISYEPLRPQGFLETETLLGALMLGLTALLLWGLRKRSMAQFGLLWFCLALAPAAQVLPHHVHRADRFLYLPLVGIGIVLAAAIRFVAPLSFDQPCDVEERPGEQESVELSESPGSATADSPEDDETSCREAFPNRLLLSAGVALGLVVLLLLDLRSKQQVQTWRNSVTLWENCVEVCPTNAFAHDVLARNLHRRGELERAEEHARRSTQLDFVDNPEALCNRAMGLALFPDLGLANRQEAVRLARRACELTQWTNDECVRALATAHCCLAKAQVQGKQYAAAIENYSKSIEADRRCEDALFQLSILRMACEQPNYRDPQEAVRLAQQGCEVTGEPTADQLGVLTQAYLAAGRPDMATATAEKAAGIAEANGDAKTAEGIRSWLQEQQQRGSPPSSD